MSIFRRLPPLLGLIALLAPGLVPHDASRAYEVQTIEVSEAGFNPPVCRMNREFVRFKNVGNEPRRIIIPSLFPEDPPFFDTGVLQPGEVSNALRIEYGGSTTFVDAFDPSLTGTVITPVFVPKWDVQCTPDPNLQPPVPLCRKSDHCLRLPAISADR
ncbi:MAG: hypothetical protein KJ048_07170 [Dehalococcoidia bacterium]|nr:hypothetical protein [Dehalococcoidia bacterium]